MKTKLILGSLIYLSSAGFAQTWSGMTVPTGNAYRTGNVGIGNTSPAYPLDVHTNSPGGQGIRVKQNGASGEASLRLDASGLTAGHHWALHSVGNGYGAFSGSLVFRDETDNAPRIVIAPTTGNVGIGTTVPQRQIHIANTADAALRLDASNWKWDLVSSAGSGQIYSGHFGIFDVTNNAIRLDINQAGYVGIGTDNAEQLLHLKSVADTKIRVEATGNLGKKWDIVSSGGGSLLNSGTFGIVDVTNNIARFYIDRLGEVHIPGRTIIGNQIVPSRLSSLLSVSGEIDCKSLYVLKPATWQDRVFDKSYELLSLDEVENFIKTNKHLPGIKSEKEILEKGYDVNEIDAALLEKIENLYLYIIKQQKEIDELKSEMKRK